MLSEAKQTISFECDPALFIDLMKGKVNLGRGAGGTALILTAMIIYSFAAWERGVFPCCPRTHQQAIPPIEEKREPSLADGFRMKGHLRNLLGHVSSRYSRGSTGL